MRQLTSQIHWHFFALILFLTVPTIGVSENIPIDELIIQIEQLKNDTETAITKKNKRKKLLRKARTAKKQARKSKRLSSQGKESKARRRLGFVWNNIYAYKSLLESAQQTGAVTAQNFSNLEQQALAILDAVAPMGRNELLQRLSKLKIDTQQAERIRDQLTVYIDGNNTPVAHAGVDQTVQAATTVNLDGSGSTDSDGSIVSYSWIQTEGIEVTLANEDSIAPYFITPNVNTTEILLFQLGVIDDKGAIDIASVQITITPVIDTIAPVIALNGDNPLTLIQGETFIDPGATATDNTDETVSVVVTGVVNTETIGVFTLTYMAKDTTGNHSAVERTVNVVLPADITPPVITLNGANPLTHIQGGLFTDPGATATDDRDGSINVVITGEIDTSTIGTYTLTYTATDTAGNKSTIERVVNVALPPDTTAPVITLNGDNPLTQTQGESFIDPGATALDDRDGSLSVTTSGVVDTSIAGTYTLTYTAVDIKGNKGNKGNKGVAQRVVNVTTPSSIYGVEVIKNRGNTANYNGLAEFSVRLKSKPSNEVVIPISSSNKNEGVTDIDSLTFTVDNWQAPQLVYVKGRNHNTLNGEQDYKIILGSISSIDTNYHGIDPDDVPMKGLVLNILTPTVTSTVFFAGLPSYMHLYSDTSSYQEVTYSLIEKPAGMTIQSEYGFIIWTPPKLAKGKSYTVKARATDGTLVSDITFNVTVADSSALSTSTQGSTITINDSTTNLNGLSLRYSTENPTFPSIAKIEEEDLPIKPRLSNAIRLTDYFLTDGGNEGDVDFIVPLSLLDSVNDITRLNIFHYSANFDTGEYEWSGVHFGLDTEGTADNPVAVLKSLGAHGLYFIGLRPEVKGSSGKRRLAKSFLQKKSVNLSSVSINDVRCTPQQVRDYSLQTCTIVGLPNTEYKVIDFGNKRESINRWSPATSIEQMMVWVGQARHEFDKLGIGTTNRNITIQLEEMGTKFGYVKGGSNNKSSILLAFLLLLKRSHVVA